MKLSFFFTISLVVLSSLLPGFCCKNAISAQNKAVLEHAETDDVVWEVRFKKILDDIQANSIRNFDWGLAEWEQYRTQQLQQLPITNTDSFYEALRIALRDLKDNHSKIVRYTSKVTSNIAIPMPTKKQCTISVVDGIGTIVMPSVLGQSLGGQDAMYDEAWVQDFYREFEKIAPFVSSGWIIDLTQNYGGNMYPMLAALSYFFEESELGGFYSCDGYGNCSKWLFSLDGKSFAFIVDEVKDTVFTYANELPFNQNCLPIVVLIGPKTASSGEIVALALQRQKRVTLMGQPTRGLANANRPMQLPDGFGYYALTGAYDLDAHNEPLREMIVRPEIELPEDKEVMYAEAKKLLMNKQ
jgi:carboxyl-terminal processing protease